MLVRIGYNSVRSGIMRFIYEWNDGTVIEDNGFINYDNFILKNLEDYGSYTSEDTQDNIIWLITDKKSYEEMREYYEKN